MEAVRQMNHLLLFFVVGMYTAAVAEPQSVSTFQ